MKKLTYLNCDAPLCTVAHSHRIINDDLFVCQIAGKNSFGVNANES